LFVCIFNFLLPLVVNKDVHNPPLEIFPRRLSPQRESPRGNPRGVYSNGLKRKFENWH